ncbi:hypothetical protein K435DRAFT_829163 [Dendrothele bispora CBS 962.96]|uniref:GST N-terminal domain-containing protein n=1 Tax=Dendrothele bispora (strain CBS 962.96) TaxID=1314807 RepID=A0A4S8LZR1_DENBC|nr:hypothetical protein K435DRAFT_829163 [Dendrothele bispora CBS 962.96]
MSKEDSVITLYDVPSKLENRIWNPMPLKVRYCLKYKGLAYKTVWLEYPDIEPTFQKLGIPPDLKVPYRKPDGTPLYTVPAIYDPKTKSFIIDSLEIAEYLDRTYPDTPPLVPPGTHALMASFNGFINPNFAAALPFLVPRSAWILNPSSEQYFRRTREAGVFGGRKLEEVFPTGNDKMEQWEKMKDGLQPISDVLKKEPGPFVMGSSVSFADFALAGMIGWARIVLGNESEEWQDMSTWHEGVFGKALDNLKQYEN